jgi:eukaryotic-like serine/threonine-protein kinase
MIGKSIAHYEILNKLGEGGMGVVYRARDTHLDRFVAIKVLPAEAVVNPERKRRFVQEAKSASALNHPNIITIFDISSDHGTDFIAMEYVAGKPLDELLPRNGMPLGESLKIGAQVADALTVAHGAGIVHRDLKPANIMVGDDGRVRVLDFGLAKLTDPSESSELDATRTVAVRGDSPNTEEGTILGTASYMSPEQAEGRKVDARSDIFSFGSVLYEMVTGRRPFRGESNMSTLAAIINKDPEELPEDVPYDLRKLLNRCLRKDPSRRMQHMDDVRLALEDLREESASGTLSAPVSARDSRAGKSSRFGTAAALVAVAAVVVAGWSWFSRPTEPVPEQVLAAVPLTAAGGSEYSPSFSPDGNQVAYCWKGEDQDNYDIFVKLIGTPTPLRLTTNPANDYNPAWSPDGRFIAFIRSTKKGRALMLVPAIGGPERVLIPPDGTGAEEGWRTVSWFPDGQWLVSESLDAGGSGLWLISESTGEVDELDCSGCWSPKVSPDGRRIAVVREVDVGVLSLDENLRVQGEPLQLTSLNRYTYGLAWSSDGKSIIFGNGLQFGDSSLWTVPADGAGPPQRLAAVGGSAAYPDISRTGDRVAFSRQLNARNIWGLQLESPGRTAAQPTQLVRSTREDYSPGVSPDGSQIVFISNRTGETAIWKADADGGNAVEVYSETGRHVGTPRFSPDGRRLAFDMRVDGLLDIYVLDVGGGRPIRVTDDPANDLIPSWSADGSWIYFHSNRTGRNEIWKVSSGGGKAVQVTTVSASAAKVSADGSLFYKGVVRNVGLWRIAESGGEPDKVLESVRARFFAVTTEGVYWAERAQSNSGRVLKYRDLETREDRVVTMLPGSLGSNLEISRDGRMIVYGGWESRGSDLMLVENFR